MNENNMDELLLFQVSDEMLEAAASTENDKLNNFTQWVCTAVYFCPGP